MLLSLATVANITQNDYYIEAKNGRQGLRMKPKLIICGAAGRMGRRIVALATEEGMFEIAGAVEKAGHPDFGKDAGLLAGVSQLNVKVADSFPAKTDVVIDFSLPEVLR